MPSIRWLVAQIKNIIKNIVEIGVCLILALIVVTLEDIVDIWDDAKDDTASIIVCSVVAIPIFGFGFHELLHQESTTGYFHMVLAMIPGAPGLRFWFNAWSDGARRTMEWHRT